MVYQAESYEHWRQHLGPRRPELGHLRRELHRRRAARRRGVHRRPLPHRRGRVRGHPAAGHLLPRRPAARRAADAGAARGPPPARLLPPGPARRARAGRRRDRPDRRGAGRAQRRRHRRPALPARPRRRRRCAGADRPGAQPRLAGLVPRPASTGRDAATRRRRGRPAGPGSARCASRARPRDRHRHLGLPAPRPTAAAAAGRCAGQYLTLRLPGAGDPAPVRSYSLSSAPSADGYRISVKREPHGPGQHATSPPRSRPGDALDVAAPRGEFVLDDGAGPVVLLSAGIGVTPVLAMLHAARRAAQPARGVVDPHAARTPADARARRRGAPAARRAAARARAHLLHAADAERAATARTGADAGAALGLPADAARLPLRTGRRSWTR